MNVADLIGKNIKFIILGQYQESLTPELYMKGTLVGVDQAVYLIESEANEKGKKQTFCVPMSQCLLSTTD
ncbi:MAG: hypothetical protein ACYCSO_06555 [Cuniculiplasma sp.]